MTDYFLIIRRDAPNSVERRKIAMEAHLKFSDDNARRFLIGGALRTDPDGPAEGSAMIIKADNLEDARAFADQDPFTAAGVYADTEIKLFRAGIGEWIGDKVW